MPPLVTRDPVTGFTSTVICLEAVDVILWAQPNVSQAAFEPRIPEGGKPHTFCRDCLSAHTTY